jgi:hypothetical protein
MLDLHFREQHFAVLCQFNLSSTANKPNNELSFTYILIVPLGPKLVLSTSYNPLAALMLTAKA